MKTRLCTNAVLLKRTADTLIASGEIAQEMEIALDDAKYLIEGLHGDFTKKCCGAGAGELCGAQECDEVGCIYQKYCRIKTALKKAGK